MSKKIEFDIVFNSSQADASGKQIERSIASISSNLNVSLAKLEGLQTALKSTGKSIPMLDTIQQLNAEIKKSEQAIKRLKDETTKVVLMEELAAVKATKLPPKLGTSLGFSQEKAANFIVGDLNPKLLSALEKLYADKKWQGAKPKIEASEYVRLTEAIAKAANSPKLLSSLEALRKEISVNLQRATFGLKPLPLSAEAARLQSKLNATVPAPAPSPSQAPKPSYGQTQAQKDAQRLLELEQARNAEAKSMYAAYRGFLAAQLPVNVLQTPQSREAELNEKRIGRLSTPKLTELGFSSAQNSILRSEALYDKYKPLSFVEKELLKIEAAEKRLAQLQDKSIPWKIAKKAIDESRRALEEYAKIEFFLQTEAKAGKLSSAYEAEYQALSKSKSVLGNIVERRKELKAMESGLTGKNLSTEEFKALELQINNARAALEKLASLQELFRRKEATQQAFLNRTQGAASAIEAKLQVSALAQQFGKNSSQVTSFKAEQSYAAQRASFERAMAQKTEALKKIDPRDTQGIKAQEAAIKDLLRSHEKELMLLYEKNAVGVKARSLREQYEAENAALGKQNTVLASLRDRRKELNALEMQARTIQNLSTSEFHKLTAEIDAAQRSLSNLLRTQIQQRINTSKNTSLRQNSELALTEIEQLRKLEATKSRYGENSLQAIDLKENQQLETLRRAYERKVQTQLSALNSSTSDSGRALIARNIQRTTEAYRQETAAIVASSSALRENSLNIQARIAASNNLLLRLAEYAVGYKLIHSSLSAIHQFASDVPGAGVRYENTKAVLEAMYVTSQKVNEQFSFLSDLADRTGGRLKTLRQEFADYSASAMAAGEASQNVRQSFSDLMEISTTLHLPDDKVHSVFQALIQMYGKNQVMAEELKRQLGNALPGVVALFARSQGQTTAELLKQMKAGQVFPKEAIPKFLAYYKQVMAPEKAFETASQGFYANLGRMQNEYVRLTEDIYKKNTSSLIGFTKIGAAGLETVREHLDDIALVMKEIATIATVIGGMALFKAAGTAIARSAIRTEAAAANAYNARLTSRGQLQRNVPSAENADTVATYATLGMFLPNLLAIGRAHPGILLVTAGIVGLTVAIQKLDSMKVDLGDNISISRLEELTIKGKTLVNNFTLGLEGLAEAASRLNETSLSDLQAFYRKGKDIAGNLSQKIDTEDLIKLGKQELTLNDALAASYRRRQEQGKKTSSTILSAEEERAYKTKELQKQTAQAHSKEVEEALLAAKKLAMAEPVNMLETLFDNKVFTRQIELIGRSVEMQVQQISSLASAEISRLEAKIQIIDRKAAKGLLAPGNQLDEKLKLIQRERETSASALTMQMQLEAKRLEAGQRFSTQNTDLQTLARSYKTAMGYLEKLQIIGGGTLPVNYGTAENPELRQVTGLGRIISENPTSKDYLSFDQQKVADAQILKNRKALSEYLASPQGFALNPGLVNPFVDAPTMVLDSNIQNQVKTAEKLLQQQQLIVKDLQQLQENSKLEDFDQASAGLFGTDLSAGLIAATLKQESGFNPAAVSRKGARGLMQVMPATGAAPDEDITPLQNSSSAENLRFGMQYLDAKIKRYADVELGLAAYNAGSRRVDNALAKADGDKQKAIALLPRETREYVKAIPANAKNPEVLQQFKEFSASFADLFKESINKSMDFSKEARTVVPSTAWQTFVGQQKMAQFGLQAQQEKQRFADKDAEAKLTFQEAAEALRDAVTQAIQIPFLEATKPLTFEAQHKSMMQQTKVLRATLENEKTIQNPERRVFKTNEEVSKLLQMLDILIDKQRQLFYLEQTRQNNAAAFALEQSKLAREQVDLMYQLASPIEKALRDSRSYSRQFALMQSNKTSEYAAIDAQPISEIDKLAQKEAYQQQLDELEQKAHGLATYFRTELTGAMQSPLKAFIAGTSSFEDTLKSFGYNVFDTIAQNISQSFANAISTILVDGFAKGLAGGNSSSGGFWGSVLSSFVSGFGGMGEAAASSTSAASGSLSYGFSASEVSSGINYSSVMGAASGGLIDGRTAQPQMLTKTKRLQGKGNGTSDDIQAVVPIGSFILKESAARRVNLSNGEIFVAPEDVKKIGLEKLNTMNYAEGGLVGDTSVFSSNNDSSAAGSSSSSVSNSYTINIHMQSSGDSNKDAQNVARTVMTAIAKREAELSANTAIARHLKRNHKKDV